MPAQAPIEVEGAVDISMIRYNAAHRGAEQDIFPNLNERKPGVVSCAVRWYALAVTACLGLHCILRVLIPANFDLGCCWIRAKRPSVN